ncbi:bifunctional metallophosphatase/5'-nucleotidase [candidate division KSB1 bacterium]|nr:bifunctional metallophosphatase/5'-nucleotidase [candidate division KSB1 bacterium]
MKSKTIKRVTKLNFLFFLIFFTISCKKNIPLNPPDPSKNFRNLTILYTNDEHGWMEATTTHGGAAGMVGLWKEKEGYTESGPYLILSGGDMWTGPAISTWTHGEAMAQVMNAMDYSAAAIGNHEFDFKVEGLMERLEQSEFPFLSANIKSKTTGEIPDFAMPYLIKEVNDIKIGIIGLTTTTTPLSTFPDHVKDFDFINYADALQEVVPKAKQDGAELLVITGHICAGEIRALIPIAKELGISVIGGGHCHRVVNDSLNGIAIIESGSYMQGYAKVELVFDTAGDTVVSKKQDVVENIGGSPDPEISTIVTYWQGQTNATLSEVIGYAKAEINRHSNGMHNMVTDSWLFAYPAADISCTNAGGIRQSIPAGDITLGTIVGVLPFENNIIELELTGTEIKDVTDDMHDLIVGGMTKNGFKLDDGTPLEDNKTYRVLTTDYLYARSDNNFSLYDTDPYYTSILYRQPTIDWIKSLNTSAANPLDQYLDHTPR